MKHIVQHTHIKHARKGDRQSVIYAPGDEIELDKKEAEAIGDNVKAAGKPEAKAAEEPEKKVPVKKAPAKKDK